MNCLVQGVYGAVGIWRIKKKKEKEVVLSAIMPYGNEYRSTDKTD
jgi:hypothetical protein